MDQGFLSASTAPCNALGQDCSAAPTTQTTVTTAALIGTYCTSNNAQLTSVETGYTGDFITIQGTYSVYLDIKYWTFLKFVAPPQVYPRDLVQMGICDSYQVFRLILGSASTCSRTDNANGNQYYCGVELNTGAGNTQSIDICGKIHNFL